MQKPLMEAAVLQTGEEGGAGLLMDSEEEKTPVRIIPIPLEPVSVSCSTTEKSSGCLSFRLNGRLVPLPPAGAELKLHSHPSRSASGFTSIRALTPTQDIQMSSSSCQSSPPPPPAAHPSPVITAVVSGEAAERVFKSQSVDVPVSGSWPTATSPGSSSPAAPTKLPLQGNLEPISPPDCQTCRSQYKLMAELRGFMCLCSPALAHSLNVLKKRKKQYLRRRRRRERWKVLRTVPQHQSKACRSRPGLEGGPSQNQLLPPGFSRTDEMSDDLESQQLSSAAQEQHEPACVHSPQGKLVIMVEDFYYGSTPQAPHTAQQSAQPQAARAYSCVHCPQTLHSNISLMSHVQEHVSNMSLPAQRPMCPHCFRYCASPFQLQGHIQAVHQPAEQPAGMCKICELTFANEPAFLQHMKHSHRPGEMPYACQVCDFRSSFYSEVWAHFEQLHANTNHFLCRYCLKVLHSSRCYQQHFRLHQMKVTYSCSKCRLHFLYAKERIEHVGLHHRTHLRPPQLRGIKPGTKVTVRTYSAIRTPEDKERSGSTAPCKVVRVDLPSPTPDGPPKKLVERLGPLVFTWSLDREEDGVPPQTQRCLECLCCFLDFRSHFPSLVHCSLCPFTTCCSLAYANHMINNHTINSRKPHYNSIFQSDHRLLQTLRCTACALTTHRGDVMANHLLEGRGPGCMVQTHPSTGGPPSPEPCRRGSSPGQMGGGFVPLHLLSSHRGFTRLSVQMLPTSLSFSCSPAMTVKFLGAPPQCDGSPLASLQKRVVCSALLHGVPHASRCFQMSPQKVQSWVQQTEQQRSQTWFWSSEKLAEWVLVQREQQQDVSVDTLLQAARDTLGDATWSSCYDWVLDFLLRHKLDLDRSVLSRGRRPSRSLPRNTLANSRAFLDLLSPQLLSRAPHLVGAMDELPVFLDLDLFQQQDGAALQLWGSGPARLLLTVVLTPLADGSLLPPLLLCTGNPCCLPEGFPDNVLLEARPQGFPDQDCLDVWVRKVWEPHASARGSSLHLLMADVHRGHLDAAFRTRLGSLGTNVVFIPSGCSSCIQPLDVCVTPVLREFLQVRWKQLVSQGALEALGMEQLALTLACWISELSSILNAHTHFLRRSFSLVSSLQSLEEQEEEVAGLLQDLSRLLLQPPPTRSDTRLQVVLIMQPEGRKEKKMMEEQQEEAPRRSPSGFHDNRNDANELTPVQGS